MSEEYRAFKDKIEWAGRLRDWDRITSEYVDHIACARPLASQVGSDDAYLADEGETVREMIRTVLRDATRLWLHSHWLRTETVHRIDEKTGIKLVYRSTMLAWVLRARCLLSDIVHDHAYRSETPQQIRGLVQQKLDLGDGPILTLKMDGLIRYLRFLCKRWNFLVPTDPIRTLVERLEMCAARYACFPDTLQHLNDPRYRTQVDPTGSRPTRELRFLTNDNFRSECDILFRCFYRDLDFRERLARISTSMPDVGDWEDLLNRWMEGRRGIMFDDHIRGAYRKTLEERMIYPGERERYLRAHPHMRNVRAVTAIKYNRKFDIPWLYHLLDYHVRQAMGVEPDLFDKDSEPTYEDVELHRTLQNTMWLEMFDYVATQDLGYEWKKSYVLERNTLPKKPVLKRMTAPYIIPCMSVYFVLWKRHPDLPYSADVQGCFCQTAQTALALWCAWVGYHRAPDYSDLLQTMTKLAPREFWVAKTRGFVETWDE